ncbi:MAG: hypothetical protein M3115_01670 [Thermoproteota archaeon]|nr:hypothetical protein [Thermoproteota archaeon]MDQ4100883.1 hypothetical protein [Thermoproteota archaeon]
MDGTHLCKEITNLHDDIASAEIVEKGVTIASHIKSGTLTKLERLFSLTELYMSTLQANAEYLGRPHYLLAHNDNTDLFFFSVVVNGRKMLLVVRVFVPYTHDEIVNKMREYVGNLRPKYR